MLYVSLPLFHMSCKCLSLIVELDSDPALQELNKTLLLLGKQLEMPCRSPEVLQRKHYLSDA